MKKPFVIAMLALLGCGGLAIFFVWRHNAAPSSLIVTEKDMAEAVKKLGRSAPPPQIAAVPLDLKRPVRLAIGSLGLADENQNRRISDLVLTELSGAPGLNLVERQSLDAALREMSMSLSGLVRAKDAVRIGKLLKADWFLLGTEAKFGGTNFVVVRVVDAHTGILRDAGIFSGEKSPVRLSADIAAFVRKSRQMAAIAKPRTYLAIGTLQDLSVNNRQATFPSQLRSYLTAAYQGTETTLLEREAVDTLLQEVRLDLAGLTENGGTNAPQPMQSAYWLVDGSYQSYETTNFQVELVLEITRMFGRREQQSFRGEPDRSLFQQVKSAIDSEMNRNRTALWPTRNSEAHVQMLNGKELAGMDGWVAELTHIPFYPDPGESRRNFEEAIRAFQSVLLLEPTNREAKIRLAACLRRPTIHRVDEARDYYREILEDPAHDKWTGQAQQALVASFNWSSSEEKARWFASAARQNTNSAAAQFYQQNADAAGNNVIIESGEGPKSIELAQKRLLETIRATKNFIEHGTGSYKPNFGMYDFVDAFRGDRPEAARQLVDFLPRMKSEFPEITAYLLASVLEFQMDTNTPVLAEFEQALDSCIQHPEQVFKVQKFWREVNYSIYDWCFEKTNYGLAVKLMEGERLAASQGNADDFDDQEKIKLAYTYIATERWQGALNIFESFSGKSVRAEGGGPWGPAFAPILTDKLAVYCREKMGVKSVRDPRQFDISANVLCMHSPSVFTADAAGLWVAIAGQLIRLDFDLKTNFISELPIYQSTPIKCMAVGSEKIWIGTQGDGLVEFDKGSRQSRHITEADGLMMDEVSSLDLVGDNLWIGYAGERRGGLGVLDLHSQKIKSYMVSLAPSPGDTTERPPSGRVGIVLADRAGDLWTTGAEGLRRLHIRKDVWESPPDRGGGGTTSIVLDDQRLIECVSLPQQEYEIEISTRTNRSALWVKTTRTVSGEEYSLLLQVFHTNGPNNGLSVKSYHDLPPKGVLHICNPGDQHWHSVENTEAFPRPANAMFLDGRNLWLGGEGFVSLLDLNQNKMLKTCHLQIRSVERIQIAGGYVWAQFDGHLHRAALADLY